MEHTEEPIITLSISTPRLDEVMQKIKKAYGLDAATGRAMATNTIIAALRDACVLDDKTPEQVRESLEQGVAKGYDLLDMLASTGAVALLGDLIDHAIESDPGRLASPLRRGEVLFDATKVGN